MGAEDVADSNVQLAALTYRRTIAAARGDRADSPFSRPAHLTTDNPNQQQGWIGWSHCCAPTLH
jgi:hypothetical protein